MVVDDHGRTRRRADVDELEVVRRRHLQQPRVALDGRDPSAGGLDERGAVGRRGDVALERAPERGSEKRLRRLHGDELRRGRASRRPRSPSHALDGVGERQRRDGPVLALAAAASSTRSITSSATSGRAASWTRTTAASSGTSATRGAHRLRARRAAGHAGDDLAGADLLGEEDRRLLPPRRHGDDDRVDPVGGVEALERLGEERPVAQVREGFRAVQPEPLAASCCGENGPGTDIRED